MDYKFSYDELVEGYYRNLNDTLRNFRGGPGFLESWVLDENHSRSLLDILDLAIQNGASSLEISLSGEVAENLDVAWLQTEIKDAGQVKLERKGSANRLLFHSSKEAKEIEVPVSPFYSKKLAEAGKHIDFEEGVSISSATGTAFSAESEIGSLHCWVDAQGVVSLALHERARGPYRALLDRLCYFLKGRPIQEGAEHAVIRLENSLREEGYAPKGKGIILPQNADAMFQPCLKLVREIFSNYRETANASIVRNEWRDPLPAGWISSPIEQRKNDVESALRTLCESRGLQDVVVSVVDVKNEKRFVLAYQQQAGAQNNFAYALIQLEKKLRTLFGLELELQLESLEDKNKREGRTKRPVTT